MSPRPTTILNGGIREYHTGEKGRTYTPPSSPSWQSSLVGSHAARTQNDAPPKKFDMAVNALCRPGTAKDFRLEPSQMMERTRERVDARIDVVFQRPRFLFIGLPLLIGKLLPHQRRCFIVGTSGVPVLHVVHFLL